VCGIAGVAGRDVVGVGAMVESMAAAQAHRGPDGTAVVDADGAVLAMNTLLVFSPSAKLGPYTDPDSGVVLAFNGEVYNWRELAQRWDLTLGPDESDAHLLLRGWLRQGPAVLDAIDGMFALAIYDPRERRLFLARDRLGEKPLYWRLDGPQLAFASETGALLRFAPGVPSGRDGMLAVETPLGCETPYAGIQLLEAGHLMQFDVDTGSTRLHRWWSLADADADAPWDEARRDYRLAVEQFTDLLREHVAQRVPEAPFALLLSGGLDSAVLAYLMRPPVCVTVRYPGRDRLDEHAAAARIAADIGAQLIVVQPDPDQFRQALGPIVQAMGYPMGNAATFSEYVAYQAVAQLGIRVVVAGLGPDEFLLGYARHALAVHGVAATMAAGLHAYGPLAAKLLPVDIAGPRSGAYARLVLRGPDPHHRVRALIDQQFAGQRDLGQGLSLVDLAVSWRPLVLTSDALSSWFGLERRSPYLAKDLVEFAYAMPLSHKIPTPGAGKQLLRDAARILGVPAEIWQNTDKVGFASAVPHWLAGQLGEWCDHQITRALTRTSPGVLRDVLERGLRPAGPYDRYRMQALFTAAWLSEDTHALPKPEPGLPLGSVS
jgi:asparagine synthase (glutamine-hydrolysing)